MSQLTALENRSDGGQDDPQAVDVQTDLIFAGDSLNDDSVHVSSHLPILVTNSSAIDDLEDQEHLRDVENLEDIIAGVEQPFQGQAEEGVDLNDYMEYYELPVKIEKSVERFETLEDVSGEELHRNDEDFEQHAKEVGGLLQAIAKDKFDELDEEHPKLMLLDANEAINSEAETVLPLTPSFGIVSLRIWSNSSRKKPAVRTALRRLTMSTMLTWQETMLRTMLVLTKLPVLSQKC